MLTAWLDKFGSALDQGKAVWVTKTTLAMVGLSSIPAKIAVDYLHANHNTMSSDLAGTKGYFLIRKRDK